MDWLIVTIIPRLTRLRMTSTRFDSSSSASSPTWIVAGIVTGARPFAPRTSGGGGGSATMTGGGPPRCGRRRGRGPRCGGRRLGRALGIHFSHFARVLQLDLQALRDLRGYRALERLRDGPVGETAGEAPRLGTNVRPPPRGFAPQVDRERALGRPDDPDELSLRPDRSARHARPLGRDARGATDLSSSSFRPGARGPLPRARPRRPSPTPSRPRRRGRDGSRPLPLRATSRRPRPARARPRSPARAPAPSRPGPRTRCGCRYASP